MHAGCTVRLLEPKISQGMQTCRTLGLRGGTQRQSHMDRSNCFTRLIRENADTTLHACQSTYTLILPGNGSVVAQESENSKFYIELGVAISN